MLKIEQIMTEKLFERITDHLSSGGQLFLHGSTKKRCFYPNAFQNKGEVVLCLWCCITGCEVYFCCPKELTGDAKEDDEVVIKNEPTDFVYYLEGELMPFCKENTDWERCPAYELEEGESKDEYSSCQGCQCDCEPFGQGIWNVYFAKESDFDLLPSIAG